MRAVTIVEPGRLEVTEHADPQPGTGEALVRVHAAGLNGADLMQLKGMYPAPPNSPPDIPGLEFAGEVMAVGPASTRFAPGDAVMAVVGGGGQAELISAHERTLLPVPHGIDWVQAGGFAETFTTAHDALFTQAGLRMGERVLINGAAGGVGVAAVQLAVRAGARVTASVRAESLRDQVQALGAEAVIAPGELAAAGPFDVILELVGAPNLAADIAALATRGRIVVIGIGAGARTEIDLRALMGKRGQVMASTLRARPLEEKALCARRLEVEVLPLLASGLVHVPVAARFALHDAERAYERFTAGAKFGKVVIEVIRGD
ncbi:MAG: zinc-binding dehydrogenase [Candidatus Dormibacteraeota bacterium]|uniref:Zinc-binding dehydrogenase n=1 Tax=Candidatus Amunia macphersoniae TaxID=3127014 RepID=A0A934KNU0_9BACT|nr:zinc-binding dehydrogenase [Candidatus Dormibacteraeota bacterium]